MNAPEAAGEGPLAGWLLGEEGLNSTLGVKVSVDGCLNINWVKATKILLLMTSLRDRIFFLFLYVCKTST